ncbi:MAG: hypothetical protein U0640_09730 [Phycisphaerales bacterium]
MNHSNAHDNSHASGPYSFASHEIKPNESVARQELIAQILSISPSASADFLGRFTSRQLQAYLDHLSLTQMPRGGTPWIRSKAPAVVACKTPA